MGNSKGRIGFFGGATSRGVARESHGVLDPQCRPVAKGGGGFEVKPPERFSGERD